MNNDHSAAISPVRPKDHPLSWQTRLPGYSRISPFCTVVTPSCCPAPAAFLAYHVFKRSLGLLYNSA